MIALLVARRDSRAVALKATILRLTVNLSDVDRSVYETLDLTVARHPSESLRYLSARVLAYLLHHTHGIAFSKGGLSNVEEPPVLVRDDTGLMTQWIDVIAPSAERLHRASKRCTVSVVTSVPDALAREIKGQRIHRADAIEVHVVPDAFAQTLGGILERGEDFTLSRSEGHLYASAGATSFDAALETRTLQALADGAT